MDLKCSHLDTPLGPMLLAASDQGLAGAWFEGQQHMPNFEGWAVGRQNPHLKQAARELTAYFSGATVTFQVPLAAAWGTQFQHAVWKALQGIRSGQTTSYGQLALQLKKPMASRAVGAAVGKNPWSIIVPCHRVVGAQGALTGYAGGLDRKVALLQLEGVLL
jgi:methylated-DNA-[protein]-cysteine S-methyltransferase